MDYFSMLKYFLSSLFVFCYNHSLFGYTIFSILSGGLVLKFIVLKVGDINNV